MIRKEGRDSLTGGVDMAGKRKKRLRKGIVIFLYAAAAVLLCFGIWKGISLFRGSSAEEKTESAAVSEETEQSAEETPKEEQPAESEEPETQEYHATLFFTGDALIHDSVYRDADNGDGTFDFAKQLDDICAVASGFDLKYYNQETILGGTELGLSSYPVFNSPQEFGDYMVSKGFNLVSTATNHTLDQGTTGIERSVEYWNTKENVMSAGTYLSWEDQEKIPVSEINGITYTMINYTYGMNGLETPSGMEYLVNCYDGRKEELYERVAQADSMADVVIVAMHWGTEYSMEANDEQREMSARLAEAGADIIIGNHPHVIQPVEWVDNCIVYYAMGNMISAQNNEENLIGMYGAVDINKTVKEENGSTVTEVSVENPRADLMYTYYNANKRQIHVYPFSMLDDSILPGYQEVYDRYVGKINEYDDSIQVGGF